MAFFYDKPLNVNNSMNLHNVSKSGVHASFRGYEFFNYGFRKEDSFGKKAMPLEATEDKIQELAMNNPRIMQIINENKLWEY